MLQLGNKRQSDAAQIKAENIEGIDMNLLLHDMKDIAFELPETEWKVIGTNVKAVQCRGCFKCWLKNNGYCIYNDAFAYAGRELGLAEQCFVISEMTYGGLSAPVKRFFDRAISKALPFFKFSKGEVHHMQRYKGIYSYCFCFYGKSSDLEKETARRYAERICINNGDTLKDVFFVEDMLSARDLFLNFVKDGESGTGLSNKTETSGTSKEAQ